MFNNPFKLANMDSNFTGATVVETCETAGKIVWSQNGSFGAYGKTAESETEAAFHEGYYLKAGDTLLTKNDATHPAVGDKITYVYNNMVVPQNDLPRIKAEMKNIPLIAKARRIAIYYSQLAAFQAKTDYGYELGDSLAEQATSRLQYKHFVPLAA